MSLAATVATAAPARADMAWPEQAPPVFVSGIVPLDLLLEPPPPAPKPKPKPAPPKARPTDVRMAASDSVWDRLAQCESGGNWHINTGNGYSGGVQFAASTWRAMGGEEFASFAYQASREEQIIVANRTLAVSGWGAWPGCSRKLGLR